MTDPVANALQQARLAVKDALGAGWCDDAGAALLEHIENRSPADLFSGSVAENSTTERPLVVALFGGTGVGKSSLMNRLAGAAVAQTGVVRPTSRTATVYVHGSIALANLPTELPTEGTHVARHHNDRLARVLLVDMPDVDSVEAENRAIALGWLPHVDLVLYVASPERYRDDVGWRVLRERGRRHGWVFVLNRWDEGDPAQAAAWREMLTQAGFENPTLLRTSCLPAPSAANSDDFEQLTTTILDLTRAAAIRAFEQLGVRARATELSAAVRRIASRFGTAADWDALEREWRTRLGELRDEIRVGMEWPIDAYAARFAVRDTSLAGALLERAALAVRSAPPTGTSASVPTNSAATAALTRRPESCADSAAPAGLHNATAPTAPLPQIWDDWAQAKLDNAVDALEVALRRREIAPGAARRQMEPLVARARVAADMRIMDLLRVRLARPSGAARRGLARLFGVLTWVLPLAALLLAAYQIVVGYFRATTGAAPFLDGSFALHSALLVLVAWLTPLVVGRALRPALERVARQALRDGLSDALTQLEGDLSVAFATCRKDGERRRDELAKLIDSLEVTAARSADLITPVRSFVARSG